MDWLASHVSFTQGLIVFLILLLFAREALWNVISQYFGFQRDDGGVDQEEKDLNLASIRGDVTHLRAHYNDEITTILARLEIIAGDAKDAALAAKLSAESARALISELKEYGIKCR